MQSILNIILLLMVSSGTILVIWSRLQYRKLLRLIDKIDTFWELLDKLNINLRKEEEMVISDTIKEQIAEIIGNFLSYKTLVPDRYNMFSSGRVPTTIYRYLNHVTGKETYLIKWNGYSIFKGEVIFYDDSTTYAVSGNISSDIEEHLPTIAAAILGALSSVIPSTVSREPIVYQPTSRYMHIEIEQ